MAPTCPHDRPAISAMDPRLEETFGHYCVLCCKRIEADLGDEECYFHHSVILDPGAFGERNFLVPHYVKLDRPDMVNSTPIYHLRQRAQRYWFEGMDADAIINRCRANRNDLLLIPQYAESGDLPDFGPDQAAKMIELCSGNPVHRLRYQGTIAWMSRMMPQIQPHRHAAE